MGQSIGRVGHVHAYRMIVTSSATSITAPKYRFAQLSPARLPSETTM